MKATWNGATLAESDNTVIVEGNHYFPPDSIESRRLAVDVVAFERAASGG